MAESIERYVNDDATLTDDFGTTRVGDQVARMALEAQTPFTLGVTGKWGAGKTSVLRRAFVTLGGKPIQQAVPLGEMRNEAAPEDWEKLAWRNRKGSLRWSERDYSQLGLIAKNSLPIWYSPWQHQNADNPLIPLLMEIRAQFTVRMNIVEAGKDLNRRGGLAGLALLERVTDAALSLIRGKSLKIATGTSEAVRQAWQDAAPSAPSLGDGQRFHLLFEDAVEMLLDELVEGEKEKGRLIIFIDDLDRCEESVVVELLEAIKLYLGTRRCVFVLGIDQNAVLDALVRHWKDRSGDSNREYLEKLFQAIIAVPMPKDEKVVEFLQGQLAAHDFPEPEESAALIHRLLEPNPRKIKNFVNSVCASWGIFRHGFPTALEGEPRARHAKRFLLFQYLRTHHRPVWRILERQPWSLQLLTKVLGKGQTTDILLPEQIDPDDQRLLEKLFFRSFSHVLRDDRGTKADAERFHRHLPIAEAVELFEQRIDRKRSDDCFIENYRDLITSEMALPAEFLYLKESGSV